MKSEAENKNWLNRTEALIGKESLEKLQNSNIVVFGLGGVGSYVVEGLVRAGIQNMCIIDKDIVDITNINRQLIADTETVGKAKVDVQEERILKINPLAKVTKLKEFVNKDNIEEIMNETTHIDYVVDAIDTVSAKLEIIKYCNKNNIKIISCMGTAKVIRKELKKLNIPKLTVLYSKEEPRKTNISTPTSISFVPSVAGLLIAGKVVQDLIQ